MQPALLWAPSAWVDGRWRDSVLLTADARGLWSAVKPGTPQPPAATALPGPVLPGLVNAHSHAFQRAFAGMAERRPAGAGAHDDFWSWRDRMYAVALRITPGQLRAVATQLYTELLCGGYTQVCEFHYLQHAPDGTPYVQRAPGGALLPEPLAMGHALLQAAADAGIGITLLPVLYQRAGFTQPQLRPDQRRFAADVDAVLAQRNAARALRLPHVNAGVAVHSLRAAPADAIAQLAAELSGDDGPIHIHVAEQAAEVDDCLAATGQRPIAWLAAQGWLDARWQLVHATHALPQEIDAVAAGGAGVVLCPSTEANLGDGIADLPRWLASGTPLALGSDSHVCRQWPEELRWLDYGQRLHLQQRNVAADPAQHGGATAARLFQRCLAGGGAAAGFGRWGLQVGARADLLVLDSAAPGLLGVPPSHRLDALVFAGGAPCVDEVWVAGRRVVRGGTHGQRAVAAAAFVRAMQDIWHDAG